MYVGGMTFFVSKSFGRLQLVPHNDGLRLIYTPLENGAPDKSSAGNLDLVLPLDAIGGLWATTRAFLYGVESLDENIILQKEASGDEDGDTLIKLYRDKPRGAHGKLSGEETCWLRLVTGRTEEERRRIKLGPRDLLCIELACSTVMTLSASTGTHNPRPVALG
ncbi:MAG: hypothetical protein KDD60_05320 [Bdellovibrionales bacterium]|nr:hypothetical protein [Bdellovibrionales bacterium]